MKCVLSDKLTVQQCNRNMAFRMGILLIESVGALLGSRRGMCAIDGYYFDWSQTSAEQNSWEFCGEVSSSPVN